MATFVITMRLFTHADSCVPRMSSRERSSRIPTAGRFMMPCTPSGEVWKGEWYHWYGKWIPTYSSTFSKYSLHAMATVAAPTAYSRMRSQPMIQATNSPIVTYEYV
jgi:hypothetical protein